MSAQTPESAQAHQDKFKPQAWETYSLQELGEWVHLLAKRSQNRSNEENRQKDLQDAQNYLDMMQSKLNSLNTQPQAPSKEWLTKMAEIEDGKCVSVGGLACELGMVIKESSETEQEDVWENAQFPQDVGKEDRLCNHGCAWTSFTPGIICGKTEKGWINEKGEYFQWAHFKKDQP